MQHYFTLLESQMKEHWDAPILCDYKGEEFTYGDIARMVAKFHLMFEAAGIRKGDHISIAARNSARWAVSFLAVNTYEAVVVPLLADFHPDNISSLVEHSDSVLLFTDPEMWPKLSVDRMPGLKYAVSVKDFTVLYDPSGELTAAMAGLQAAFDSRYPMGFSPVDVSYPTDNMKDLAIINYTSGTTSAPKGVMLRYECLATNVVFGQKGIPTYYGDTILSMLPLAHAYGLMFEFLYPLCGAAKVYFLGKTPSPTLLMQAFKEVKPFSITTVPLVMEKIFKTSILPVLKTPAVKIAVRIPFINNVVYKKIHDRMLESFGGRLRVIIMGGAALNKTVEYWFRKIKLPFTIGYGMTEASPLLAYEDWKSFVPGSCGKVVDRAEVRIDSENPEKVAGEIQARGMNIMSGYYKNESATKAAFTEDGWMNTGDLGVIDAKGNIFIRGRSKNMILSSNGQNIYPEEIESIVNSEPYVVESVVVDRASKLVALVYLDAAKLRKDGYDADTIPSLLVEMK
ncbi:MAG: AMP-binding protein, partial [Bacteroidales bacterium]|nr:AMP-binding protein [Bacteroidales bacterium]